MADPYIITGLHCLLQLHGVGSNKRVWMLQNISPLEDTVVGSEYFTTRGHYGGSKLDLIRLFHLSSSSPDHDDDKGLVKT